MNRLALIPFILVAICSSSFAEPTRPVDVTLGVGIASSTLGDWTRTGESFRARVAHRWTRWLDTGLDAHVLRGQGVVAASVRASLGRAYARVGIGLNKGWHGEMTHDAVRPVVVGGLGGDVVRARDYTIALELAIFGGDGAPAAVFPDERFGLALDAAVRF